MIRLALAALLLIGCGDFGTGGFHPVVTGPPKPGQETVLQLLLDFYGAGDREPPPVQWVGTSQLDCKSGPGGVYQPFPMGKGDGWTAHNPTRCIYGVTVTRHLFGGAVGQVRYLRIIWRPGFTHTADSAGTLAHEMAHFVWPGDGGHKLPHWQGSPSSRVELARNAVYEAFPGAVDRANASYLVTDEHKEEVEHELEEGP